MSVETGVSSRNARRIAVMAHDLAMTPIAIAAAISLRYPANAPIQWGALSWLVPIFTVYAGVTYHVFRLYESKWRFASIPDLYNIFRAASILAGTLLVVDFALVARGAVSGFSLGEKAVFLYWVFQLAALGGPRIAYRYYRYVRARRTGRREETPAILILGRSDEAEVAIRAVEGGMRRRFRARGILSPRSTDLGTSIRGVPVLGGLGDLEQAVTDAAVDGTPIAALVAAPSEFAPNAEFEKAVGTARRLGIPLSRLQTVTLEGDSALTPIDIEDLLFRPSRSADPEKLRGFLAGRRVAVTGGGGSIGSEICARVLECGAAELMILENSEPALFAISERLRERAGAAMVRACVADVRDPARLEELFREFRPEVVFHAAALKQLPQLELDWAEGIKTNVFGSANVVDAIAAAGAAGVLISTDKAVDPISVLGATKRFSEMYAQIVDGERDAGAPRIISVRFGNVLGSVGSVVPKFKAQIARGGPVTVTHPEMVRYFMTVREAVELVILAAGHGADKIANASGRASVYVLKMGQPARIVDLAEKMIRLAGYEPGVDIDVVFTGARAGERLNEILFAGNEPLVDVGVDGVTAAQTAPVDRAAMTNRLAGLRAAVDDHDRGAAERIFAEAIPSYRAVVAAPANVTDLSSRRAVSSGRGREN